MKLSCLPAFLILICVTLASCVHVPGEITAVGGKGAFKKGDMALVWNNEKSFRDGALAVTTIAAAAYSAASQAAAETTAQVTSSNAAKVTNAKTAADSAVAIEQSKNSAAVAIEGIKAGAAPVAP